jgi:hypothetical protein
MSRRHPSPALVLSLAALFFAVGGSAFAMGHGTLAPSRCAAGAVRGTADVHASQAFPDRYTSNGVSGRYNCSRRAVQAKRVDTGVYDVRFAGNPGSVAVGNAISTQQVTFTWSRQGDGSFRVFIRDLRGNAVEAAFVLTLA